MINDAMIRKLVEIGVSKQRILLNILFGATKHPIFNGEESTYSYPQIL